MNFLTVQLLYLYRSAQEKTSGKEENDENICDKKADAGNPYPGVGDPWRIFECKVHSVHFFSYL